MIVPSPQTCTVTSGSYIRVTYHAICISYRRPARPRSNNQAQRNTHIPKPCTITTTSKTIISLGMIGEAVVGCAGVSGVAVGVVRGTSVVVIVAVVVVGGMSCR